MMVVSLIIVFAFLAMLFWGFGDFFIQKSIRKIGSIETLAWIGIIGGVGLLPFVLKDIHLLADTPTLLMIIGLGAIAFISAMFNFKAFEEGKLSVVDVVLEAELPIVIALSFIFLKETLTMTQAVIILFVLLGIILTAIKSFSHFKSRIEKGVILAFIAALLLGVTDFTIGFSSKMMSPFLVIWGFWVVHALMCLVFIAYKGRFGKLITKGSKNKKLILITAVLDTLAWLFYALALSKSEISIITAITESYPAIALFLGVWINKEKVLLHQYAGAIIAIVCNVLLATTI